MKKSKEKIYVSQRDNDKYFNQKLSTWRNGFCYIDRVVTRCTDPLDIYDFYGEIKTPQGLVFVTSLNGHDWEIQQKREC